MTNVDGSTIYGLQFVFPGDLVAIRDGIGGASTIKARYIGTVACQGQGMQADVRITGKSDTFRQHTRHTVPLPTLRLRRYPDRAVAFATGGGNSIQFHYGQAISYRGGWYRAIGSWGAFAIRLATPYGPREGIRVEYGEPVTFLTESDVRSRIRALYGPDGSSRVMCGRCGCNALSYDLVSVCGDREERICPYCAIHDQSQWNLNQGRHELRP